MARAMKDSGVYWVATIPENWHVAQLKRYASVNNGQEIGLEIDKNDNAIPVYGSGGVFKFTDTYMFNGKAVMFGRKGTLGKPIYVSGKFWTVDTMYYLTYSDKLDAKFNFYQLLAFDWIPHITQTALPSIVGSEIAACKFAFPPVQEQSRIVSFLDSACARIDAVMEQTRASIEEYKKLKQSIITEAVTKGIRPNRPMKDSDIEWMGRIPTDWEVLSLGAVTETMRNGYVGPTKGLFFDNGVKYIQSLHIKDGRIDFSRHEYYVSKEWANNHPKVKENDILIVQTGDIGSVGLVTAEYDGCNCHALIIATPRTDIVFPEYLTYYLQSVVGKELLLYYKTGALLPHLNSGKIKFASVCVPSIQEQKEITEYLNSELTKIDSLLLKKEQCVSELEAYKKSLIFEYVTGKKEVV